MATTKHSRRRNKGRRKTAKSGSGAFKRFIKTVAISATVSFAAVTWTINPQFFRNLDFLDFPDQFDTAQLLDRFHLGFIATEQAVPTAAAVDGYVQTSFSACRQFFPNEQPPIVPAAPGLRELCFSSFAILHSPNTKTPVFVAQRLNRQMLISAQNIARTDRFYEEARLPRGQRATLADYQGSGYDRGHLAPAGDMHNKTAMEQSFSLANMVPQDPQHNRGSWNKIEQDTRKFVMRAKGDVYIFTGPVYGTAPDMIGQGKVAVPVYLYKLVYDASTGRSWAHWHQNSPGTRAGPTISYADFLRRTQQYLLPPLH